MSQELRIYDGISLLKETEVLAEAARIGKGFGVPAKEYLPANLQRSLRDGTLNILIDISLADAKQIHGVTQTAKLRRV